MNASGNANFTSDAFRARYFHAQGWAIRVPKATAAAKLMRRLFRFIDSALVREFVFASNGSTASTDVTGYTPHRGEREVNTIQTKRRLASGISIISVAAALTFATPAGAQTAESTLRGTAAPGSEVVAREVNTGSMRKTTANADGTYVIAGLQAGNYHVTAGGRPATSLCLLHRCRFWTSPPRHGRGHDRRYGHSIAPPRCTRRR